MAAKLTVFEKDVTTFTQGEFEYINITDIAHYKNTARTNDLFRNWLRNRNTIEFLGIGEQLNNPNFIPVEFDGNKKEAGLNSFTLTAKQWISSTKAIGIISKAGRYGGTYAQKDIAFEFASWISVKFKLYLIKEFQILKKHLQLGWEVKRNLAKVNYLIYRDAVEEYLIPDLITSAQKAHVYATEAELLNVALFGITAKEWHQSNPKLSGNLRDHANVH